MRVGLGLNLTLFLMNIVQPPFPIRSLILFSFFQIEFLCNDTQSILSMTMLIPFQRQTKKINHTLSKDYETLSKTSRII